MAEAQPGDAVYLSYGKQMAQQEGDAVLLDYNWGDDGPVFGPMRGLFKGVWGMSQGRDVSTLVVLPRTPHEHAETKIPWGSGARVSGGAALYWDQAKLLGASSIPVWGTSRGVAPAFLLPWGNSLRRSQEVSPVYGRGKAVTFGDSFLIPWGDSLRKVQLSALPWATHSGSTSRPFLAPWGQAVQKDVNGLYPWDKKAPSHDRPWSIVYPAGPVTDIDGTIIVPIKKAYIMLNTVEAWTVADHVMLPLSSLSLNIDYNSWAWGFTANLPASFLQYIKTGILLSPIEIIVSVNGEEFLLLVEKVSRSREFGRSAITISGRSSSAYLANPYSGVLHYSKEEPNTARQLFEGALTINTIPLGWTVNWEIPDWLVPAGAWDFTGTYIEAVSNIVSSVQAYIQPDPKLKTLNVLSKYPSLPAEWASSPAYMQLPSDLVQTEAVEWFEKPNYNGIYVIGGPSGVIGFAHKDGTVGDYLAPAASHPLVTHSDAVQEHARAILAATGSMATVTLSLPVSDEVGIIPVGKVVKYVDNGAVTYGITRAVSVVSNGVATRQTIELEVHPNA